VAYGDKEGRVDSAHGVGKGPRSQIDRIARSMTAHAASRESDPVRRLQAHHELSGAIEKALLAERDAEAAVPCTARPAPALPTHEPGIEPDTTLEDILLLFLPVARLTGAGVKALGRGWTLVKRTRAFQQALRGYAATVGPGLERLALSVRIPHAGNWAVQRWTPGAFRTRRAVQQGAPLYKQGSFPNPKAGFDGSDVTGARFLAHEHPLASSTFASRHGLYSPSKDWVMRVRVKPGSKVVVRSSTPGPLGPGGAPEAVIEPNQLRIDWFHMP
jgi:hypothetical protein